MDDEKNQPSVNGGENGNEDPEINDPELNGDEPEGEEPEGEEKEKPAGVSPDDKKPSPDKEDKIPDYRPKPDGGEKRELTPAERKIAHLNKENKELRKRLSQKQEGGGENEDLTNKELEEIANELGVSVESVKKMKKVLGGGTKVDLSEIETKIDSITNATRQAENEKNFSKDFDKWSKDNPGRERLKDFYKKIAFDPDFLHLKTFEDMERHFFPAEAKKKTTEKGTQGVKVNGEKIDFSKVATDPKLEETVFKDPALKKQYYKWLDTQE